MAGHALAALGSAVDSIESRFITSGQFSLDAPLTISGAGGAKATFPSPRGSQAAETAKLTAKAEPSPFGKGGETVIDASVRKAKQVMGDDLTFGGAFDGAVPPSVLEQIRSELVPDAASISAKLHKVNIYEKGGHFAEHRDTPRSETHFGSLVVLLPAFHLGGALSVEHGDTRKTIDWGRSGDWEPRHVYSFQKDYAQVVAKHTPASVLRWAAFFGDVSHRVGTVMDGARVTLAYELYRDGAPDPMADALLQRAERVRAAFAAVVADGSCLPEGGVLGFEAAHLYEEKELSAADKVLTRASARDISADKMKNGLKNEDAVLAVAATAAGLKVETRRVLSDGEGYAGQEWTLAKMPKSDRGFGSVRNCDGCRMKGISPDEIDSYASGQLDESITWVSDRQGAKQLLSELQFGEYFGNEASTDTFYTRTILVVDVPPAKERGCIKGTKLSAERVRIGAKSKAAAKSPKSAGGSSNAKAHGLGASPAAASTPVAPISAKSAGKKRAAASLGTQKAAATARVEDDSQDEEEYEVEKILSSRPKGRSTEYLVKWKGWDGPEDSTWEPKKNLHAELIAEFEGEPNAAKKQKVGASSTPSTAHKDDDDDDDDDEEEEEEAEDPDDWFAPTTMSAKAAGKQPVTGRSAAAPPSLFAPVAGKNAGGPREIHVTGGMGNTNCEKMGGKCSITLKPGEGLRELKTIIRKAFGKVPSHKLSKLTLSTGAEVKKNDLVDGATVVCHYAYSVPVTGNLFGGGRRRGFGGFGGSRGFGGMNARDAMLYAMMMRGGFI